MRLNSICDRQRTSASIRMRIGGFSAVVWCMLGIVFAGCGGSAPPVVAPPAGLPTAPASISKSDTKASPPEKKLALPTAPVPEGIGEEEHYVVAASADEVAPRFVVDRDVGRPNVDTMAVAKAAPGVDSSRFLMPRAKNSPGRSGTTSTPNPKVAPPATKGSDPNSKSAGVGGLPAGFEPLTEFGTAQDGLPVRIRCTIDQSEMVLIPEGPATQGLNDGPPDQGPAHAVFLDNYYIDLNEITAQQYDFFREDAKSRKRGAREAAVKSSNPREPVLGVSWADANNYANWAGKSLPTEAQWEKAARGPDGFRHPWGNGVELWSKPRKPGQIDPIGSFAGDLSPYGLFDMAGNAREWTTDWYDEGYYKSWTQSRESLLRNPTGARNGGGNQRVVKGGDLHWLLTARQGVSQTERPIDVGFRCVLTLKTAKSSSPLDEPMPKTKGRPAPKGAL